MREIKFLAGLGTIFIFAAVFCFKAAFYKKTFKEEMKMVNDAPKKNDEKVLLFFFGGLCLIIGLVLILKSLQLL
jgi:formate hydrogenlyase subunit 3/multisubunit Na+/H+ antiporter MnhD subunit